MMIMILIMVIIITIGHNDNNNNGYYDNHDNYPSNQPLNSFPNHHPLITSYQT